jgi:arsenate reductase (glutaredoxin)
MNDVTIYHNPNCGTSRNTLALLRERGIEPKIIEYVKVGWTEPQLQDLLKRLGLSPRDILRTRGTNAEALGLTDPSASDQTLIDAMVGEPILVERPIVVTPKGAALCRPVEAVLALI